MLLCIVCMQAVLIGSEWWLGRWSVNAYDQSDSHYLGFYALWMSSMGVITAVRIGVVYERGIVAGTSLHNKLLARVLSATMTFMDQTPTGRILNRFSRDTSMLDTMVMSMVDNFATVSGWCMFSVLAVALISPPFIVALVPVVLLYLRSFAYYRASARDTNRLQSVNTSPLLTHFNETAAGIVTIRGFGRVESFVDENTLLTDFCHRPLFAREMVRRWMDLRLELVNASLQFFCCFSLVLCADTLSLEAYTGKVIYLDFWASWCGPCAAALPAIDALQKEFGTQGFQVLAVNVDQDLDDARRFLAQRPVDYPNVADPNGAIPERFAVDTMPTSFLIDREGIVRHVHKGFRKGDESELRNHIQALVTP